MGEVIIIDYFLFLIMAIIIDLIIGDPLWITHPVVYIGRLISLLERIFRILAKSPGAQRIAGILEVLIVIVFTYLGTYFIIEFFYGLHYIVGIILSIYLLQSTIAIKGLVQAGNQIYGLLEQDKLSLAREAVNKIVGRDCDSLKEEGVVRAAIETLAENTSDGILAPIFFYLLGGVPLAMTYKAVNTLDSMLGYKNDRYRYYGWAAARLDDLVNLIPARITGICLCLAAGLTGQNLMRSCQIMFRDAAKHPSPNAGYPEGAVAGALGIRLGGINYYHGQASFRAYLGDKLREFKRQDIKIVNRMIYVSIIIFLLIVMVVIVFV